MCAALRHGHLGVRQSAVRQLVCLAHCLRHGRTPHTALALTHHLPPCAAGMQAQELKRRMKSVLIGRQQDYVAEVKGPGQVIGEVSLEKDVARHKCSARARDNVTVVKLTEESFLKALMQQYNEAPNTEEMELYSTKVGWKEGSWARRPGGKTSGVGGEQCACRSFVDMNMVTGSGRVWLFVHCAVVRLLSAARVCAWVACHVTNLCV